MKNNFITVNDHIRLLNDGRASIGGGPFNEPVNKSMCTAMDYEKFILFSPPKMPPNNPDGFYPIDISHGKLKHYPNGVKVFIKDKTEPPRPSPNKGKPLYDVTHLAQGGRMLKAKKSGDVKLELPLLKNGKLSDLGDLLRDLNSAYYNTEWVLETETFFPEHTA